MGIDTIGSAVIAGGVLSDIEISAMRNVGKGKEAKPKWQEDNKDQKEPRLIILNE